MKKYKIRVSGCDDDTEIEFEMSDEVAVVVKEIAQKITEAAKTHCQPNMSVEEV